MDFQNGKNGFPKWKINGIKDKIKKVLNQMNDTVPLFELINQPTQPIYIYNECSLTEWGIFLSSILLSGGAFVSQILAQVQRSKCKTINCWGSSCIRDVDTQ